MKSIIVAGDVKDPIGVKSLDWVNARYDFGSYGLECPEGYTDMGDITISHDRDGNSHKNHKMKKYKKEALTPEQKKKRAELKEQRRIERDRKLFETAYTEALNDKTISLGLNAVI